MQIEYKFWYVARDDDDFITEAAVRWHEMIDRQQSTDEKGRVIELITRRRLDPEKGELDDFAQKPGDRKTLKMTKDAAGSPIVLYHQSDFGRIKTDEELFDFMDDEILKHKGAEPILEQTKEWREQKRLEALAAEEDVID